MARDPRYDVSFELLKIGPQMPSGSVPMRETPTLFDRKAVGASTKQGEISS